MGKKKNSTQQLIGARRFTRNGIATDNGELIFFALRPTNLAVLSYDNVQAKVHNLRMLLQSEIDIELLCIDSYERFDDNKAYLRGRCADESGENVRTLLKRDLESFDDIHGEVSASRQFLICVRNKEKHEFTREQVSNLAKHISGYYFDVRHIEKRELKRLLGIYLGAGTSCDMMPDYDGQQYMEDTGDEE